MLVNTLLTFNNARNSLDAFAFQLQEEVDTSAGLCQPFPETQLQLQEEVDTLE